MNSQMKRTIITFVFLLIGAFTYFVYLNDMKRNAELNLSEKEDSLIIMRSHFLKQIELTEARVSPDGKFFSQTEADSTIRSLTLNGKRFGLFVERSQCEQCWERALAYLEKNVHDIKYMPEPIILVSGYNRRDFQLMLKRHHISFPVYLIDRPWEIENLLYSNQPFYFVLDKDGRMKYIFYPEGMYELMGRECLRHVTAYCFPEATGDNSRSDIELVNPEVDLGTVSLRQKRTVELCIRNNGKNKRRIRNIIPSCNCLLVEDDPETILPGNVGTITVSFLSHNKGQVKREVQVSVEGEVHPYVFKLTGNVI